MIKVLSYLLSEKDALEDDFAVAISLAFARGENLRAYVWAIEWLKKFPNSPVLAPMYMMALRIIGRWVEVPAFVKHLQAKSYDLLLFSWKWVSMILIHEIWHVQKKNLIQYLRWIMMLILVLRQKIISRIKKKKKQKHKHKLQMEQRRLIKMTLDGGFNTLSYAIVMYRQHFPIFTSHKDLVFLDSASSAQKPESVIQSMTDFLTHQYANIHSSIWSLKWIIASLW